VEMFWWNVAAFGCCNAWLGSGWSTPTRDRRFAEPPEPQIHSPQEMSTVGMAPGSTPPPPPGIIDGTRTSPLAERPPCEIAVRAKALAPLLVDRRNAPAGTKLEFRIATKPRRRRSAKTISNRHRSRDGHRRPSPSACPCLPNVMAFSGEALSRWSILSGRSEPHVLQMFRAERRGLRPTATPGWAAPSLERSLRKPAP
jgi:hypothetical protein